MGGCAGPICVAGAAAVSDGGRLRYILDVPLGSTGGGASIRAEPALRRGLWMAADGEATEPASGDQGWAAADTGMARVLQLTPGQCDCLRLVFRHMTSKDIARTLGVSPHTVDMRLRTAMKTLGVASRIEAARVLIEAEGKPDGYQPLIYQASELARAPISAIEGAPVSTASFEHAIQPSTSRTRPDDGPPVGVPPRPTGAPEYNARPRPEINPLAGSLPWGPRNDLSAAARLSWIAVIAIGSALGFGAILGALEALAQLL